MDVRRASSIALAWLVTFGLLASGCARPAAESPPDEQLGLRVPYVIGIPDILRLKTSYRKEETSSTFR